MIVSYCLKYYWFSTIFINEHLNFYFLKSVRKVLFVALALVGVAVLTAKTLSADVLAGGDQVQGDKGAGSVEHNGSCPFGGDTPPVKP